MALGGERVETEPSSFEEAVKQPVWIDAMVEKYDSIVWNNVLDVVPRPEDKSVMSSRWLYKMLYLMANTHGMALILMKIKKYAGEQFRRCVPAGMPCREVSQKDGELFVSQGKYANEILRRFHMEKCKPMQTPLGDNWRKEDVTLGELSQAMVHPTKLFWKAMKHVLRYLRGTSQYGIWFRRTKVVKLQGFTDADSTGSPSNRKSTSGGILILGSVVVSWYSRTQRLVELSSTEAEYMSTSQATCEAIWMCKMLVGLFD
eukprot:PITA_03633